MKNFIILFIATFMVQNISAQDVKNTDEKVVYVDENGHQLNNWEIEERGGKIKSEKNNIIKGLFELAPKQKNSKQITVKPIRGSRITTSSGLEAGMNYYLFEVVKCADSSLKGKNVACQVMLTRKSNLSGAEGQLVLRPLYVDKDSEQIPLVPNDIYRRGLNRTNVKEWTAPLIIPLFIAGSKAKILPNEEIVMTLAE